ncbi:hypothetical protein ACFVW2_07270 [Streptomyces sp. NPDC058171]
MKRITSLLTRSVLASALAAGGLLVLGNPAEAFSGCSPRQEKEFSTSGFNTEVWVAVCIDPAGSGTYQATAHGGWVNGGGVKKFDNFDVQARVERNNVRLTFTTCDYTAEINGQSSGTFMCSSPRYFTTNPAGLTGDGRVDYDLDADGAGGFSWNLTGSPSF